MAQQRFMSAREAAAELGINMATLYAYVSRGLIRSEPATDQTRVRRYHREDVQRLKQRKAQQRDPAQVAAAALHWGTPVLDSAITLIADGQLFYRGYNAVQLARTKAIEQVAALIWTGSLPDGPVALFDGALNRLPDRCATLVPYLEGVPVFERFQTLLPLAALDDVPGYDARLGALVQTAARVVGLLTVLAAGVQSGTTSIASALQQHWAPHDPAAASLLNAALILCADHELNVSSFTARCVASAGATPYAVVEAALAALQGAKHGGHTERVAALLREVGAPHAARTILASRLKRGDALPGFGHRLYLAGDPRGALLAQLVADTYPAAPSVALALAVVEAAQSLIQEGPTIDFGLVMLAEALGLASGSALALFALGRSVGWLGHALEQYVADQMIRPRARYIGPQPMV